MVGPVFNRKETMEFPLDFAEKYTDLLGRKRITSSHLLTKEAVSAYRTNPLKKQQKNYPDAIPENTLGSLRENFWEIF